MSICKIKLKSCNKDKQEGFRELRDNVSDKLWCCSHHDSDLSLIDIQVWDVVDVHPFESAADAAVRTSQKHHREASWKTHKMTI